jgi:hypothetical protein
VHQEFSHTLRFRLAGIIRDGFGIEGSRVQVEAASGAHHITHHQSDRKGQGRDNLEVEKRHAAHAANLLHVLHASDAGHHRAEDDQGDDRRDQPDKDVPKWLHGDCLAWTEVAERDRNPPSQTAPAAKASRRRAYSVGFEFAGA